MTKVGVWKGMNLDGGGSTTMVNRPLAEMNTQLTFNTEYGTTQRSLTHSACSPRHLRALEGLKSKRKQHALIGQIGTYELKGYDTYYNPIEAGSIKPTWKSSNGNLAVNGQSIKATKPGTSTLTAVSGDESYDASQGAGCG